MINISELLSDKDVALILRVSISWVKGQRYKRKHGEKHEFDVSPIYIGKMPRYRREDVAAWLETYACPIAA